MKPSADFSWLRILIIREQTHSINLSYKYIYQIAKNYGIKQIIRYQLVFIYTYYINNTKRE